MSKSIEVHFGQVDSKLGEILASKFLDEIGKRKDIVTEQIAKKKKVFDSTLLVKKTWWLKPPIVCTNPAFGEHKKTAFMKKIAYSSKIRLHSVSQKNISADNN